MNSISSSYKLFHFIAACLGCFFILGCENDEKVLNDWTKKVTLTEKAKNITSYFSQEGKMKARLKSPLMLRYMTDTNYVEFPNTLHVDFYNDTNRVETWLDCLYGKYFESQNKVYLRDSVVVINIMGDTLKSPDLWWDQNKKIFYTDQYAEYHTKDKNIYGGKGLEATQDMKSITFKYPEGTVKVPENGFTEK